MSVVSENTMTPPDDHEVNAEYLNDLPAETHKYILEHLDIEDYRSLRLVSKVWDAHLRIEAVVPDLRSAVKNDILLLENARDPLGGRPFFILDVRVERETHESGDATKKIVVDVYRPVFMKRSEWLDPLDLEIFGNNLLIQPKEKKRGEYGWEDRNIKRDILNIDYDTVCRGNIIKATPAHLRSRFKCLECRGSVCPGCGGFSMRFDTLFTGCGWDMPCPVCIGYNYADHGKQVQDDPDDPDALESLWAEIKETIGERDIKS